MAATRARFIFLLALERRSGTNFLYNLIKHHPEIAAAPAPFWEDFVLHEAHRLRGFAEAMFGHWSEVAGAEATPASKQGLEAALGDAVCHFMSRGVERPFVVTKTPSIRNLEMFHRFFPEEKLVILLRDGRDVVASGMRSFGWSLEDTATAWARAVETLQAFCRQAPADRRLIVRFEDLVRDQRLALTRIFGHVGVDPTAYDWTEKAIQRVIGSSTLRDKGSDIHWTPVDKDPDFNPIGRWRQWSEAQKRTFERRAGRQLQALSQLA